LNINPLQTLEFVGIDSTGKRAAIGTVTSALVVPATSLAGTCIVGSALVLPDAHYYVFDLATGGTINGAGNTCKLDILVQTQLTRGDWADRAYYQAANRTLSRAVFVITAGIMLTGLSYSGNAGFAKSGSASGKITNSSSGATPALSFNSAASFMQLGNQPSRIIVTPRLETVTVPDTVSLIVTAALS
jgi:hypothetical protein